MSLWDMFKGKKKQPIALNGNPTLNHNFNQTNKERFLRNPNANPDINPAAYADQDMDGVSDNLELPRNKPSAPPMTKDFNRFHVKQKSLLKQNNIIKDDGSYVPTCTYPLPPVKFEKKQLFRNKLIRNKHNQYLQ